MDKLKIKVIGNENGYMIVQTQRPFGTVEKNELTPQAYEEYLEQARNYCDHKKYELVVEE